MVLVRDVETAARCDQHVLLDQQFEGKSLVIEYWHQFFFNPRKRIHRTLGLLQFEERLSATQSMMAWRDWYSLPPGRVKSSDALVTAQCRLHRPLARNIGA